MNPSLLSDGEARAYLIFYSGVPKVFCSKCVTKGCGTESPVAELAWLVLPSELSVSLSVIWLLWPGALAFGYFLAVRVLSSLHCEGLDREVKGDSDTCQIRTSGVKAEMKMCFLSYAADNKVHRQWTWIYQILWKSSKHKRPSKMMTDMLGLQLGITLAWWLWQRYVK